MSESREEQILILKTNLKKSLQTLSLPESLIDQLEKIPEADPEKRTDFIKNKIELPLETEIKKLKEGECCLLPSIQGPNNFSFILKIGDHTRKLTGAMKNDGFELIDYEGNIVKSSHLEECVEKVVFSFEKHMVIPIVYESHRRDVLKNSKKILEDAFENHVLEKVRKVFSYLGLKEIDESTLWTAFEKGSEDIIQFLLQKIYAHELIVKEDTAKERIAAILDIARHRAARGDQHNLNIAHALREYLQKQYPDQLATFGLEPELEKEKMRDEFFKTMLDLYALKPTQQDFQSKRHALEKTLIKLLDYFSQQKMIQTMLNLKMGPTHLHPLDIIVMHGSPTVLQLFLQAGAEPTVGWKNEKLENFKQGMRSALSYILSRSERQSTEKKEISSMIEGYLIEREVKENAEEQAKKNAAGTFELMDELTDELSKGKKPRT